MDGTSSPTPASIALSASLDELFRQHDRWLRPLLRLRYGATLADDLAHETYLRAAPYVARGEARHPRSLLLRIAANLASNWRRAGYWEVGQDAGELALSRQAVPSDQYETLALKQIVLALPQELRDVFILNHILRLTYQEVADRLGIPLTTVHHRMRKALERTSRALRD